MDNKLRAIRSRHMRNGSAIIKLIRRSFVLAGLCIFSDVAIALLITTIHKDFPEAIFAPLAMYDLNLIVNLVCILLTFRNWKEMLFPWIYEYGCKEKPDSRFSFQRSSARPHVQKPGKTMTQHAFDKIKCYDCGLDHKQPLVAHKVLENFKQVSLQQIDNNKKTIVKVRNETLKPDFPISDNSQNKSEIFFYSDTVLQVCKHIQIQPKRSASLILTSGRAPSLAKRVKPYFIASLLNKSKLWITGQKSFSK